MSDAGTVPARKLGGGIEMEFSIVRSRTYLGLFVLSLFSLLLGSEAIASASTNRSVESRPAAFRLPGHVLPALKKATIVASDVTSETKPLTLTLVLKRDDQPGFDHFLHDLYDPHSSNFHKFLTQRQIADRFGPSRADYDSVLRWMRSKGFKTRARLEESLDDHDARHASGCRARVRRAHRGLPHRWPDFSR